MKCLCGSGKDPLKCHGLDTRRIRSLIKYEILKIDPRKNVLISSLLKSQGFDKNRINCRIKFRKVLSPAGEIIYPFLITHGSKAIRPLTIDGLGYFEEDNIIYQHIFCMLTPISSAKITIDMSKVNLKANGYFEGECELEAEGDPFSSIFAIDTKDNLIKLYHHTTKANKKLIDNSMCLKASKWNLQGTDILRHNHYVYFTDLERIEDDFDLLQIGMARAGTKFMLQTDDNKETLDVVVYRDEPENRNATLTIWIDPELITLNPLILHEPQKMYGSTYSWWEVFHNSIFRVPVHTDKHLPIKLDKSTDEYILIPNENLYQLGGFLAAHGMDMLSMLRILSEVSAEELPRINGPTAADLGRLDMLWVKTWERNLAAIVFDIMKNRITNE